MPSSRFFRYLAPNLITLSSMIFGLVSLWSCHHGDFSLAGWMICYAVLTDRLDGLVARAVKGTSELGMQLDSFADFLNFGIAPSFLVLTYLTGRRDLPYADHASFAYYALWVICGAYTLCAVFRLARYNVISDDAVPTKIFFGFPTTLAGGTLSTWFLLFLKYDPASEPFGGAKLFGGNFQTSPTVWTYLPIAVAVLGYLMASRLPMPKIVATKNRRKLISVIITLLMTVGYICGFLMRYPEVLFWMPTLWCAIFLVWGQVSARARAMRPPALFPRPPPPDQPPVTRPQEDLEDIVLDETAPGALPGSPPKGD